MHDLTFTSPQVAAAIGMSHDNFRAHLSRKGWRIVGKPQPDAGRAQTFGMHDVLGYALARILTKYGVDTGIAFERAMLDFAHTGDESRAPGGIYNTATHGRTLYVYSHDAVLGHCLASRDIADPLEVLFSTPRGQADAAVIVDLTALRERVFQSLGLDSRDYE